MHPSERGKIMRKLGELIAEHAAELAEIEVNDNGKLIAEMAGQLKYIPNWYDYFGGLADKIQGTVIPIDKPDMMNFTRREPLGVCVGITAWNSPLLLASFKTCPRPCRRQHLRFETQRIRLGLHPPPSPNCSMKPGSLQA